MEAKVVEEEKETEAPTLTHLSLMSPVGCFFVSCRSINSWSLNTCCARVGGRIRYSFDSIFEREETLTSWRAARLVLQDVVRAAVYFPPRICPAHSYATQHTRAKLGLVSTE